MKFGLMYNTGFLGTDPDQIIAVARHAEQCGFESFYFAEHIALYPGASLGPVTFPASTPVADPLECLAFVAAAAQLDLMRETARAAGRDPAALESSRWGSIDMTADDVAAHAARGTTRLVVGPASTGLSEQEDQISAFAARLALG